MNSYYRAAYSQLTAREREAYLQQPARDIPGFRLTKMIRFAAFGQSTDTAVYQYTDAAEFVFVPGDTVTLGWDGPAQGMDDATREDFLYALEEYGVEDLDRFLRESCSPVRTVVIPSMLVERTVREIGWLDVPLDHPAILEDDELRGYLEQYQRKDSQGMLEISDTLKLQRRDGKIRAQLYEPVGWEELIQQTEASGFSIPTEDEWEYLCGGGSRTLWRWGDSFDYDMRIPHFEQGESSGGDRDIRDPNQFGLTIAFDPYIQEVVSGPEVILKGGDGGCNICGGLGIAAGFLPVGTYYKGYAKDDESLEYLEDIGGDYTSFRRIIRLESKPPAKREA